jgi:uncharacterized protein YdhG (YjbR/CyaY superfamily)
MPFETHEQYFATVPVELRARLAQVQNEVERLIPGAIRCISYAMPAFKQRRCFFYFAAFKKHLGVYPPVTDNAALVAELARYRGPKGNLQFPHDQELPLELIGKVAVALAAQYTK